MPASFPFAMFVVLTIFLQAVLGMSAIHAGLTMIPTSLGIALTTEALSLTNNSWDLAIPLAITGLGTGSAFAPLNTLAMRDVPATLAGAASGVLFTNRQVGQAMGSAVIGSVPANGVASALPR